MSKPEYDITNSKLNISLTDLWHKSYIIAKQRTPKQMMPETYDQYYRDLGISVLYEFSEQIRKKADELLRMAIDEDH